MSDDTLREDDTWDGTRSEGPGSRIGPFTLTRRIGEGGFGDVYEAVQERPVRRKVAMKIVKLGMDTRDVIARFALERQALALMEHPHIARVLDAGATDSGRPYFVMELVDGEPISDYCDNLSMPIDSRLRLFEQVCAAVQHAHTKGVIHRDLKPGNVLVSTHEGQPYAKVIDFGIAKATSGDLSDRTRATRMDQVMGTALYMSPEQARGSADIDTRADIYSLGVILYELLTGSTPVERGRLLSVSLADTQRLICESEPPVPSARLMKMATSTATSSAGFHANDPRGLARRVRGELDWIVMKALEKDPARRYETASAFAADVHRFLEGEPVLAVPPSAAYRLRKFVLRNKVMVAAGAMVALALLVGIIGFAWQAQVARKQEGLARQRASELEKVAKYQAAILDQIDTTLAGKQLSNDVQARFAAALAHDGVAEPERARQVAAFAAQWRRINATDTATRLIDSTLLKPAVAAIDRQLHDQPQVAASLREVLASRYFELGLFDESMPLQQSALATFQKLLGDDDVETIESQVAMGKLLDAEGKSEAAEPHVLAAISSSLRRFGPDNIDTLEARSYLAQILRDEGKSDEAEAILRDVLVRRQRVFGADDESTLVTDGDLGGLLLEKRDLKQAEPLLRASAEGLRRLNGEDDIDSLTATNNLGVVLVLEGKTVEAEALFRKVLDKRRRLLGEEHPDTLQSLITLGGLLLDAKRLTESESLLREAAEKGEAVLGEEDPGTLNAKALLGKVLFNQARYAEVDALLSPSRDVAHNVLADSDPALLGLYLTVLGRAHVKLGRFDDAQSELMAAEALDVKNLAPSDPGFQVDYQLLADLYAAWNAAEPGNGYDLKASEWKQKLAGLNAAAGGMKKLR